MSELGDYILSPAQAPIGTKRLSNLLRSRKLLAEATSGFLWKSDQQCLSELTASRQDALLIWDESVLEKAESLSLEGLCAGQSSVAARLRRIKPDFHNPPGGRL